MNVVSLIAIIIIASIVVLPFVFFFIHLKRSKQKRIGSLQKLASESQAQITKFEMTNNVSIGMDETRNLVFLIKTSGETSLTYVQDLSAIRSCHAKVDYFKEKGFQSITRIGLEFWFHDNNKVSVWYLYDQEDDLQLGDELSLVKKWEQLIGSRLTMTVPKKNQVKKLMAS